MSPRSALLGALLVATTAAAQDFPSRGITIVAPFPAGSTPEELRAFTKRQLGAWAQGFKEAGIDPE